MNIVLVMDQFDDSNNGTTITARRLAQNLRDAGHKVTILAGGSPQPGKLCAQKHKIPFFQKLIESQGMCFAKPDPALYYEAFKDADIVHLYMPFRFCSEAERHARQMHVPTVAAFHVQPENITSTLFLEKRKIVNRWLYRWFYKKFYNRFGHIHCPSRFIANQLALNGYKAETHVISNGVSHAFYKVNAQQPAGDKDIFNILMIGRLSREKRQDLLIKAVQKSKYADRIQITLAGQGPREKNLRKLGRRLKNKPVMRFFSQQELVELINRCDLYVHASDAEIEGISCLEAMACGLVPVISDSVLSATGQFALCEESLFKAGNVDDLARRIDYWLDNPEKKAEYSKLYQAQQQANRVDICAAMMVELYEKAIVEARAKIFTTPPVARWKRPLIPNPARLNSHVYAADRKNRTSPGVLPTFVAGLVWPFNKLIFGFRIRGKENLAALKGGAVSVCNHTHPLDCVMAKNTLMHRRMWLVSLRENFEMPIVGGLIKALGAVALGSGHREQGQLQKVLQNRLANGDIVHYYPEGMLVPYSRRLRRCHNGAFAMAVRAQAPVLPLVVRCEKRGGLYRLKRRPCLTLYILPPVYPDAQLSPKQARTLLQKQVEFKMRRTLEDGAPVADRLPKPVQVEAPEYEYDLEPRERRENEAEVIWKIR